MSPTLKWGLLFGLGGLVGLPVVLLLSSFIPVLGSFLCLCSPLISVALGGAAGHYSVRQSTTNAGIGQGVLSGTIAGVGALLGVLLFIVVGFSFLQNNPTFQSAFQQAIDQQMQQQPDNTLSPEEMTQLINATVPIVGICSGVLFLLASLVGGAIGAAIAGRNRTPPPSYMPPSVPPSVPPAV